jgi:hypothetical protein
MTITPREGGEIDQCAWCGSLKPIAIGHITCARAIALEAEVKFLRLWVQRIGARLNEPSPNVPGMR